MAAVITATVPTTAHQRWVRNVPDRTRNSPTNPFNPGSPTALITTARNRAAMIGIDFCRPPRSAKRRVPRRSQMTPTRKKMAPVVRPWFTISITPPVTPCRLKAKKPRTMKATSTIEA